VKVEVLGDPRELLECRVRARLRVVVDGTESGSVDLPFPLISILVVADDE
jgi:hypothetical protein